MISFLSISQSDNKHIKRHNNLTSFFRRILSFITVLPSFFSPCFQTYDLLRPVQSQCTSLQHLSKKTDHKANYKGEEQASNFVAPSSCSKRKEVQMNLYPSDIVLDFLGDRQWCLWHGQICCIFSVMFFAASEYHTATHPKENQEGEGI